MMPQNKKPKTTNDLPPNQFKSACRDWSDLSPARIQADPKLYLQIPSTLRQQPRFASEALLGLTTAPLDSRSAFLKKIIVSNILQDCPGILSDTSLFRQVLNSGDDETIHLLLSRWWPTLASNVSWDKDLALLAIGKAPSFYFHVPESLKRNDKQLAYAAIMMTSSGAEVEPLVRSVRCCCPSLFSERTALQEVFDKGGTLPRAVLLRFSDQIVWDQDLVDMALMAFPASYSFLPARFRKDNVEAQQVMASLLNLGYGAAMIEKVHGVIAAFPDFFADRDAVQQLFLAADSWVVSQVVKSMSTRLPWDRDLTRLATKRCVIYQEENLVSNELTRLYKENSDCKHHLPMGMLISSAVLDAVREWPDFLNTRSCALTRDNSLLLAALEFVEPILRRMDLSPELTSWLEALVGRVMTTVQRRQAFHTLLKCISVADGGRLEFFQGDDETSVALKRHMAELLGAPVGAKIAVLKHDALKLVVCLLTLPAELKMNVSAHLKCVNTERISGGVRTLFIANGVVRHLSG